VIGTLAVDGWAVTFGTARRAWAGGGCPAQSPPRCTKCNSIPINGQCTNFILFNVGLPFPIKGLISLYLVLAITGEVFFLVACVSVFVCLFVFVLARLWKNGYIYRRKTFRIAQQRLTDRAD